MERPKGGNRRSTKSGRKVQNKTRIEAGRENKEEVRKKKKYKKRKFHFNDSDFCHGNSWRARCETWLP